MPNEIPAARLQRIRELLQQDKVVSLRRVRAEFGMSEMTIRRDFVALETLGVVRRTRGGVVMAERAIADVPYDARETIEVEAKQAIGAAAAALVEPGDTLFLSGGTTCLQLALALSRASDIVIITNSVDAIVPLSRNRRLVVLAVGGRSSHVDHDLTGPFAEAGIRQHRVEKAFVGASGITPAGVFNSNLERGWVDRTMIECAAETYVLADHTKIGRVSLSLVAELDKVGHLVTDRVPGDGYLRWLKEAGVEVHAASKPDVGDACDRGSGPVDEPELRDAAGGSVDA